MEIRFLIFILISFSLSSFVVVMFLMLPYFPKILVVVFITLNVRINFSWNPGWNILIWMKWILLFQMWLVVIMRLMRLSVFCHHRNYRRKKGGGGVMLLFSKMRDYRNIFSGGDFYSTMNANLIIHFFPFIYIVKISVLYSSIMDILLTLIILCRLIIWCLLFSTIINGGACFLPIAPTAFWDIFAIAVRLRLYKNSQNN